MPTYYLPYFTGLQLYTASTNNYLVDIASGLNFYTRLSACCQMSHENRVYENGFCFKSPRQLCGKNLAAPITTVLGSYTDNFIVGQQVEI